VTSPRPIRGGFTANFAKSLFQIFLSGAQTKKWAKKHSFFFYKSKKINEHFESIFDEISTSIRDFEQALRCEERRSRSLLLLDEGLSLF